MFMESRRRVKGEVKPFDCCYFRATILITSVNRPVNDSLYATTDTDKIQTFCLAPLLPAFGLYMIITSKLM
jgi:hypothetical protein